MQIPSESLGLKRTEFQARSNGYEMPADLSGPIVQLLRQQNGFVDIEGGRTYSTKFLKGVSSAHAHQRIQRGKASPEFGEPIWLGDEFFNNKTSRPD